jgi:outer membrane receptor protein involved in Fe transport
VPRDQKEGVVTMSKCNIRFAVSTVAVAVMLVSAPHAFAQTRPDANPAAGASLANAADIVVTATRKSEIVSKVPISITAFDTKKLDIVGIKNAQDLAKFTPGVAIDPTNNNISIRGISSTAGSGTTGIYIDDTPVQIRNIDVEATNSLPNVFDLARVEVLRGPQGTLFGTGAEGGAIRYITNQPSLTTFTATTHAELAATQGGAPGYEMGAALGGPIIRDKLGFRISAWYRQDGGWIDRVDYQTEAPLQNNINQSGTYVLRGALTYAPGGDWTITPAFNFENRRKNNWDMFYTSSSNPSAGQFVTGSPDPQYDHDRFYIASLKIDHSGDKVHFVSNTSYYNRNENLSLFSGTLYNLSYYEHFTLAGTDPQTYACPGCVTGPLLSPTGPSLGAFGAYSALGLTSNTQKNFTQEFRVESVDKTARFGWLIGAFYGRNTQFNNDYDVDPQLPALTQYLFGETMQQAWGEDLLPGNLNYTSKITAHDEQGAIFANISYKITGKLKLDAGLRVAIAHFDYTAYSDGPTYIYDNGGLPVTAGSSKNEHPVTPKVNISYQADPGNLFYATYAKGYRVGGATPPLPELLCGGTFPTAYNSDSVQSFEAGAKNKLFGGHLSVASSAFYVKWNNIQTSNYVPTCGLNFTTNSGTATSKGFDLQARIVVDSHLSIEASTGYTSATFDGDAAVPGTGFIVAAKGDAIDVPPWTATLAGQYDFQIGEKKGFVRADGEFASHRIRPSVAEDPQTEFYDAGLAPNPSTFQASVRAGITIRRLDIAVFANNVLNAHPLLYRTHEDAQTPLYEATTFRPRTFGLSLNWQY